MNRDVASAPPLLRRRPIITTLVYLLVVVVVSSSAVSLERGVQNDDAAKQQQRDVMDDATATWDSSMQRNMRVVSEDPHVLNVHMVPHTHDDVGWLKTVDQYYYGLNETIQKASVKYILDTSIRALEENPKRKFTYVEMAFFTMWWNEQSPEKHQSVKRLVQEGRLAFVNGGWCMHDEAATHYMGMIDQTTLGHSFLWETFNYTPRVGWQIDPFGHSAAQASLFTSEVGFDALYFGRIDHQDREKRLGERRCEGIWRGSENVGNDVLWGLTGSYGGNYQPPDGFDFGVNDDPLVEGINVMERVSDFVDQISWQANKTVGNNIMLTMGSDFQYVNGIKQFEMMDDLIKYVTQFQDEGKIDNKALGARFHKINLFYSNPEMYTLAKHGEGIEWERKTDDFFPYSDHPDAFWTGYFTSRASLKRLERVASSFLLASRQIEILSTTDDDDKVQSITDVVTADEPKWSSSRLHPLEAAVGVSQHHDGVSGTSKQHVAYDYAKRMDGAIKEAAEFVTDKLESTLGATIDLYHCQDLNETRCEPTQTASASDGNDIYVVAYNPLGQTRNTVLSVPVSRDVTYEVHNMAKDGGSVVGSSLMPSFNPTNDKTSSPYALHFETGEVPPAGAVVFRIVQTGNETSVVQEVDDFGSCTSTGNVRSSSSGKLSSSKVVIEGGGNKRFTFDRSTGTIEGACDDDDHCLSVVQEWGYYVSYHSKHHQDHQSSGAYIFRPHPANAELVGFPRPCLKSRLYMSPLLSEIHTEISPWVRQVTRVMRNSPYAEILYSVGPIPIDDGKGREAVTRYTSAVKSDESFYTDSNGRDFMHRRRSFRPTWTLNETQPVAGNYYPVNAAAYIEDDSSSMSILTDRSQGGASLKEGAIELMVHRRTIADDRRGVDEAMNETDGGMTPYPPYGDHERVGEGIVVSGRHRLYVGSGRDGAANTRSGMDEMFAGMQLFFGTAPSASKVPFKSASFSGLEGPLPENVMLITLTKVPGKTGTFLVRLGHQYAEGEGPLGNPVDVNVASLFPKRRTRGMVLKTLSANQDQEAWKKKSLGWKASSGSPEPRDPCKVSSKDFDLRMMPLSICTLEVEVDTLVIVTADTA